MNFIKYFSLFLFLCFANSLIYAQGCSDAGFCTMGAMKPDQAFNKNVAVKLRNLDLTYYEGTTTLTALVKSLTLDGSFTVQNTAFQVKGIYQWVGGNLGEVKGQLGDLSISATRNIYQGLNFNISSTLGAKIALGDANLKDDLGRSFPMYYQVSLGTNDVVGGLSLLSKKWLVATGFQIPVIQNNQNAFSYETWTAYPSESYLKEHPLATKLKRGSDIMFRVERSVRFSRFDFSLGLLNIYRVNKDRIYIAETDSYEKLEETTGFAITALAAVQFRFNTTSTVKVAYGRKLTDREKNPDGLTRNKVLTLTYQYKF